MASPIECLCGQKYTLKGEVWQLGVLYFQILTLIIPFTGVNYKSLKRHILSVDLQESFEDISDEYNFFK